MYVLHKAEIVGLSKNALYEKPHNVTGIIEQSDSKETPKYNEIELSEQGKVKTLIQPIARERL